MIPSKAVIYCAVIMALLAGCTQSDGITCPPLYKYSKEQKAQAATELRAINAPMLETMIGDYKLTRKAILQCLEKRNGKK